MLEMDALRYPPHSLTSELGQRCGRKPWNINPRFRHDHQPLFLSRAPPFVLSQAERQISGGDNGDQRV